MPKIVDAQVRRDHVTDAVFRIIAGDGLERVSLREVAAEADLAVGSIRHYFQDVAALRTYAFTAANQRLSSRAQAAFAALDADPEGQHAAAMKVLLEFLPMDETSALECCARMEFRLASRTDAALAGVADAGYRESAALIGGLVQRLAPSETDEGLVVEAERLMALLDGLSMHAMIHNQWLDAQTCLEVIGRHLSELTD